MALMCEECKCSTYLNEDTGMYSCENECPCCNDPDYESDWDTHLRIMKQVREYVNLYLISLEQDLGDGIDEGLSGSIQAASHILNYLDNLSYEGV